MSELKDFEIRKSDNHKSIFLTPPHVSTHYSTTHFQHDLNQFSCTSSFDRYLRNRSTEKVEQSDMFHQSSGRNQRPKGFKVKHACQAILLLVVSLWMFYQIKHSTDKPKEYGAMQKTLRIEHGSMVLGRKVDAGSSNGVDSDSDGVNPVGKGERKEDGGGGDDELDRNLEGKAQEESFISGHEDSQEKITSNDEKDDAKQLETRDRESQGSEENNLGTQVREGDEAVSSNNGEGEPLNKGHEDSKEGFTSNVEQDNSEKGNPNTEVTDRDEAVGSGQLQEEAVGSGQVEEEPVNKGHEDVKEGFTDNAEQVDRVKLETHNEEPEKSEEGKPDTEVIGREAVNSEKGEEPLNKGNEDSKESFTENVEPEDRKKLEMQSEESEKSEKGNPDTEVSNRDEAVGSGQDNDEGKHSKGNAEDIVVQHNETESISAPGQSEMGDRLQGFHDENGVPQDGGDLLNSHGNGTISDEQAKETSVDHETISSSENQNQVVEFTTQTAGESSNSSQAADQTDRGMPTDNLVIKQDEVRSQESDKFAEVDTVSNNTLEVTKTESNASVENSSQSGDNSDVASINESSEIPLDASVISERSSSGSSQQENEEPTSVKMLSQAENAAASN